MSKVSNILTLIILSIIVSCRNKSTCCVPTPNPGATAAYIGRDTTFTILLKPSAFEGKDANINLSFFGGTANQGSYSFLLSHAWTNLGFTDNTRSLLDFDLSSIPAGVDVSKATLTLYADTTTVYYGSAGLLPGHSKLSGPNNWIIKRVTSNWNENTVTWNSQPSTDTINSIAMQASTSRSEKYEVDVTKLIKDKLQNPSLYYGFMFQLANENYYRAIIFYSSDCKYPSFYPEIKIIYRNKI